MKHGLSPALNLVTGESGNVRSLREAALARIREETNLHLRIVPGLEQQFALRSKFITHIIFDCSDTKSKLLESSAFMVNFAEAERPGAVAFLFVALTD